MQITVIKGTNLFLVVQKGAENTNPEFACECNSFA